MHGTTERGRDLARNSIWTLNRSLWELEAVREDLIVAVVLDGADDCTFWYVGQYYADPNYFNWSTRIVSAKFPNCH